MSDETPYFLSEAWVKEYQILLNANKACEDAAEDWKGDFGFEIEADIEVVKETVRVYLDLWQGKCREAREVKPDEKTEYVYSGPIKNWKLLLAGKIDPINGLMSRKLKLIGNRGKVMRYIKAAVELVTTAVKVPTKFIDE